MTAEPIRRSPNTLDERSPAQHQVARHRSYRPLARRRTFTSVIPPVASREVAPLTEPERRRRVDRVAAYLVRTMRACPAPGIAPLTTRDWLVIASAVLLPYLVVFAVAAAAPVR
jgi:hypothetical protein